MYQLHIDETYYNISTAAQAYAAYNNAVRFLENVSGQHRLVLVDCEAADKGEPCVIRSCEV